MNDHLVKSYLLCLQALGWTLPCHLFGHTCCVRCRLGCWSGSDHPHQPCKDYDRYVQYVVYSWYLQSQELSLVMGQQLRFLDILNASFLLVVPHQRHQGPTKGLVRPIHETWVDTPAFLEGHLMWGIFVLWDDPQPFAANRPFQVFFVVQVCHHKGNAPGTEKSYPRRFLLF